MDKDPEVVIPAVCLRERRATPRGAALILRHSSRQTVHVPQDRTRKTDTHLPMVKVLTDGLEAALWGKAQDPTQAQTVRKRARQTVRQVLGRISRCPVVTEAQDLKAVWVDKVV